MRTETELIFDAIKRRLKKQELTYSEVAQRMGLTEAAVKNLFHSKSITLDRLLALCQEAGVSLGELLQSSGLGTGGDFELSEENERIFVERPGLYAFFRELVIHRRSLTSIRRQHQLEERSVELYLRDLEKMRLIERTPAGSLRLKVRGQHKWRVGGPWFQKHYLAIVTEQARAVLHTPHQQGQFLSFGAFSLSKNDVQRFQLELEAVVDRFKAIALEKSIVQTEQDRLRETFVGFNVLVSAGSHPSDREPIPNRKT